MYREMCERIIAAEVDVVPRGQLETPHEPRDPQPCPKYS